MFSTLKLVGLVLRIGQGVMMDPSVSLDGLTREIVGDCNPSLRLIGISLGRHTPDAQAVVTWYRCIQSDDIAGLRPCVEELPRWEGESVENRLRSLDRLRRDN